MHEKPPTSPPPLPPPPLPLFPAPTPDTDDAMWLLLPVNVSAWAIAAGYLGLFALVIVPAPLALIVSIVAMRDIIRSKETPKPKRGMGRAIFGLITGLIGTLVLGIAIASRFTAS